MGATGLISSFLRWMMFWILAMHAAHGFDHASRFVAQYGGRRIRIRPVLEVQVRMTDAGGDRANKHLARTGVGTLNVLDLEWFIDFA